MAVVVAACGSCSSPGPVTPTPDSAKWSVREQASVVEIGYGSDTQFAQYAALHTGSSYFRLVFGPDSGWGTSVVLLPSFWSGGQYFQGAPITATWTTDTDDLVISFSGMLSDLDVSGEVRLLPPRRDAVSARVSVRTSGTVRLDRRSDEAFKPLMLSSMHVSPTLWDTDMAFVGPRLFSIPDSGWVIQPAQSSRTFGLRGGTSSWKSLAPTIKIVMDAARPLTGWVTASNNPNDDNVGLWAASDHVLPSWHYTITATRP